MALDVLDRTSSVPLHHQLVELLRKQIISNNLQAGEVFTTEDGLQKVHGVSRSTVRQALSKLEHEGFIVRERGRGTLIATVPHVEKLPGLRSFTEEMRQIGRAPVAKVLSVDSGIPDDEVKVALGLTKNEEVVCLTRLMFIDDLPVVVFRSHLPTRLGITPELDFEGSLYDLLESKCGLPLREASETIEASGCPQRDAEPLGLSPGAPVLIRRRVTYVTNKLAVEYVEGTYHAQRYKYQLNLER